MIRASSNTNQAGILVGLVSITAFFVALSVAFYFSVHSQIIVPRIEVPRQLWLSTGILLGSSVSLEAARYSLRRARLESYRNRLGLSLLLGCTFLFSQLLAWVDLKQQGVYMKGNPHGSVFFVFTGLHGVHLLGGIVWLWYLHRKAAELKDDEEQPFRRHRSIARAAATYWHYMGALWVVLFTMLLIWT
jgi:cytochrome c oxidase subunit III